MIQVLGAEWCAPCKALKKQLNTHSIMYSYIDVEQNPHIVEKYDIQSVPTIVFPDDFVYAGAPGLKQLRELIEEHTA